MGTLATTNIKHASSTSNNIILSSDGSTNITNIAKAAGETIETLTGICDGRTITVGSGNYTLSNVVDEQTLTTSHAAITGSTISYTPPSGTKTLIYRFSFQFAPIGTSGISHYTVQVDNTDINPSKITMAGDYVNSSHHHSLRCQEWIFDLTETSDDIANGKIAGSGWTSNKTLRVTARLYNTSSYQVAIHRNDYWDGATATGDLLVVKPRMFIQAIA